MKWSECGMIRPDFRGQKVTLRRRDNLTCFRFRNLDLNFGFDLPPLPLLTKVTKKGSPRKSFDRELSQWCNIR